MTENSPLVSVIIPVYNVEEYLRECVDSTLSQTYGNLEIILVDDGSPDGCPQICDEYAGSDSRIKVIHKPNGGLSDARNAGIDIANGEFLSFVDSDDRIAGDMVELLYRNLKEQGADMSCCGHFWSCDGEDVPHTSPPPWEPAVMTSEQAAEGVLSGKFSNTACGKLYKSSIFDSIRFPAGKIFEDARIIMDVFATAGKIVFDPTPKYYYRQRKGSISDKTDEKAMITAQLDMLEHRQDRIEELFPNLAEQSQARLYRRYIRTVELMLSESSFGKSSGENEAMPLILRKIKDNAGQLMKNPHLKREDKTKLRLLKTGTGFYRAAMSFKRIFKSGKR